MNFSEWRNWLKSHSACTNGYNEAKNKLPNDWYQATTRSDWMLWVLRKIPEYKNDKSLWVKIAVESAKSVVRLSKDLQQRPQKAIEAAENWLNNPSEENRKASAAASAAAYAYAAADACAYASATAPRAKARAKITDIIRTIIPNLNMESVNAKA